MCRIESGFRKSSVSFVPNGIFSSFLTFILVNIWKVSINHIDEISNLIAEHFLPNFYFFFLGRRMVDPWPA